MHTNDETLLMRMADGDEEACVLFYESMAPRVYGQLVKILSDWSEAEDVLQEVMWEVWRRASTYNPLLGSPATWVLVIARARGIDRYRKRARSIVREPLATEDVGATSDETENDTLAGLSASLEALPAEMRQLVQLAFVYNMSRQQMADHLGLPVGTVKTRIRKALAMMRQLLQEQGAEAE
ncbi:MAG: sigma-70 family RNA polymerase sigma factor [Phycisphaerales bacterium]